MSRTWFRENYAFLVFFAFLALALCYPTQSNDLFFYLSLGRRFFETGALPLTDPFVFTVRDWHIHHEWLSYVVYYASYLMGGFVAVTLFKAALWLGLFFLLVRQARRAGVVDTLTLLFLLIIVLASSQRFMEKASLFSDVFLLGLTALFLGREKLSKKWHVVLPLLFVVWVNLHPGYVLGLAIFSAYVILQGRNGSRGLWASLLGCFAACLVNPDFLTGAIYPIRTAFSADWGLHRQSNAEWMATFRFPYILTWQVQALISVIVLTCVPLAGALRKGPRALIFPIVVFLFYFYLAYDAVRFISTSALGFGLMFFYFWEQTGWRWRTRWEQIPRALVVVLIMFACGWMIRGPYGPQLGLPERTVGFGVNPDFFPVKPVEFIKAQNLRGRFFNQYGWGSFLIWELNRDDFLLVHGHVDDPKVLGLEYEGAARSQEIFDQVVNKYKIQFFLLEKDPAPTLLGFLSQWKLIYQDTHSALWVR